MTGLYIFIALIAIALLGWAVAELQSAFILLSMHNNFHLKAFHN